MDLSIIIPAYNEAAKIAADVTAAAQFLHRFGLSGEVIVVDDGSSDGTGEAAAAAPAAPGVHVRVLRHDQNHGKGASVRTGVVASHGDCVLFADAGLCVPFEDALPARAMVLEGRCQVAHGSRKLPQSVIQLRQSLKRRLLSNLFRRMSGWLTAIPPELTDTQCGFKLYRGDVARELYRQCRSGGFMFDIEILLRARKRGYRVCEFPVHWSCDRDTRLLLGRRNVWGMFRELRAIARQVASESGGEVEIPPAESGVREPGRISQTTGAAAE